MIDVAEILLVSKLFPPKVGGVQSLMEGIAENSSHNIDVLTDLAEGADDQNYDFTVFRRNFQGLAGAITIFFFLLLHSRKYDLIYFSRPTSSFKEVLCKLLGNRVLVHAHGTEITNGYLELSEDRKFSRIRSFWRKTLFPLDIRSSDRFIAVSEWTQDRLLELGVSKEKTTIVHPGIDFEEFRVKQKYSSDNEMFKILSVGRLVERKGHSLILDAVKNMNNIKYQIAGTGPVQEEIEDKIENLGIEDKVELLGYVEDDKLGNLYRKADLFALTSLPRDDDVEAFGIVYLEANAAGLPVIGTDIQGIPSAVKDEETGFLVEPNSINIRKKILELKRRPELRDEMGKRGVRWARKHDWSNIVNQIDSIIDKVVKH